MTQTGTSTPKVFISYRRSESGGHAGRLYDAMVARFGEPNVFMDIDMQPGLDFVDRITDVVGACRVLLVVMGPDWGLAAEGDAQPRISHQHDFVRLEVATALRRPDVTVIPLLVEGARMPDPDDLPESLRALARRNALELSDTRWRSDIGRLLDVIETLLAGAPVSEPAPARPPEHASVATPAAVARGPAPATPLTNASAWLRAHTRLALAAVAVAAVAAVVVALAGGQGGDPPAAAGPSDAGDQPAAQRYPRLGDDPLAWIRKNCEDKGQSSAAGQHQAQRHYDCNAELPDRSEEGIHGASLAFFKFVDGTAARRDLFSSEDFEVGKGGKDCKQEQTLKELYGGDVWCRFVPRSETWEIYWRLGKDGNLFGTMTFDDRTMVELAIRAWSELL